MASTSKAKEGPVLPRGWSQHESKSNPGRVYYFNEMTGARTWDIRDIVSRDCLPQTGSSVTSDINSMSVSQLEQLLEQKKKEEAGKSLLKRKSSGVLPEPNKRAKIVFDLPYDSVKKKIEKNPIVTTQRLLENKSSSRSKPQVATPSPSRLKKVDRSNNSENSEESLVLDEDELQQLKIIKKKHKSPSKPKRKQSPLLSPQSKRPNASPKKSSPISGWSPSPNNSSEMLPKLATLEATFSSFNDHPGPSLTKKISFDGKCFRTKYVNYENEVKLSYNRKPTPNVPAVKSQPSHSSAPQHLMTAHPRAVDVTPDHECEVTPVFGSLEESDDLECGDEASNFCLKTTDNMFDHLRRVTAAAEPLPPQPEENYEQSLPEPEPVKEDQSVDNSYEVARPPSPTLLPLVQELEEEENMDWETVDMEEVLLETQRVRGQVCQATGSEHGDHEHDSDSDTAANTTEHPPVTGTMVVVDTNVLISNLPTVNRLIEMESVMVGIPWMVVQELDQLKVSETSKTAVGARAGVRWLHQTLVTNNKNNKLWTETAAQSRQAAAKFESKSPDDRILATCLQKCEEELRVVLVTNDVNLSNKAIINHVQSGSADNIMDIINNKEEVNVFNDVQDEEFNYDVIRDLVDQMRDYLRDMLEGVLRKEFLETYGEQLWEKIVSIKPRPQRPHWTLSQLFTLFSKHHQAVFGLNYPKNGHELKSRLTSVKDLVGVKKVFKRYREVKVLLAEMEKLLQVIKQKDDYEGLVSICSEKLVEVSNQVKDIEQESKNQVRTIVDNVDSQEAKARAQSLFQQVWEIIAAFTRGFASFLGVANNIEQFEPNIIFHSKADVIKELPPFLSTVGALHEAMEKAVTSEDDVTLNSFYDLLTNFRSNIELNLSHWPPSESSVSRKNLFNFIRNEHELVKNGLGQLTTYRQVLINCIYDNNNEMEPVAVLRGHVGRVWCCAWHPSGDLLASCGEDKTVRLWERRGEGGWVATAVLTQGHTRTIRRVAWSPCGHYLASASFDGTVAVWDQKTGEYECGASLEGHENEVKSVAWSPGGEFLATCSRDKSVWLWDVDYDDDEYSCASVLHTHTQDVKSVRWHPELPILASCSYDNTIRLYKEDGDDWVSTSSLTSHTNTVWDIAWDRTGDRLASVSEDASVKVWRSFRPGNNEGVHTAPGGEPSWKCEATLAGYHTRAIYSIDWSREGALVTGGGDDSIRVWQELDSEWTNVTTLSDCHDMDINCVTWNPKHSNLLASCSDDETVKIWKIENN